MQEEDGENESGISISKVSNSVSISKVSNSVPLETLPLGIMQLDFVHET